MAKKQTWRYGADFRQEALRLVEASGLPVDQVARDLGIGKSTLHTWVQQARVQGASPTGLASGADELRQEVARLRKENALLKQQRDILKAATAFFAKEGSR